MEKFTANKLLVNEESLGNSPVHNLPQTFLTNANNHKTEEIP